MSRRDSGTYIELDDAWNEPGWTSVPNTLICDVRLSLKARGLAAYLISIAGTQASAESIAKANNCGRDQVSAALRELKQHGYLTREQVRDRRGAVVGVTYIIHDEPRGVTDEH